MYAVLIIATGYLLCIHHSYFHIGLSATLLGRPAPRAIAHGLSNVGIQGHVSLYLRQGEARERRVNRARPKPELQPGGVSLPQTECPLSLLRTLKA